MTNSLYAFAGDTIDPVDTPTVTIARDVDGQRVLMYQEPENAAELGRALIYAALRESTSAGMNLDNIDRRAAVLLKGYGLRFAANIHKSRLADYGV